ncbi:MAG: winged helix-turn-helix domain-containing protein [Candidatus Bathyarchaeia archaeon]
MSKITDERLSIARTILEKLRDQPMRWTELQKVTTRIFTYARFQSTLSWLLQRSYINRIQRGLYSITDKGRDFLEAI